MFLITTYKCYYPIIYLMLMRRQPIIIFKMDGSQINKICIIDTAQLKRETIQLQHSQQFMHSPLIEVRMTDNMGRGVFATQTIPPATIITQIHKSRFITYSLMIQHPLIQSIMNRTQHKIVEFCYFLAYVELQEQITHNNQLIKSYIQQLPKSYNNLICWTHQQLNQLQNTELVSKIKSKKSQYEASFHVVSTFLHGKTRENFPPQKVELGMDTEQKMRGTRTGKRSVNHFDSALCSKQRKIIEKITFEDIIKYIAVVQSRNAYFVDINDCKSVVGALVPFLELFNHSEVSKCKVYLEEGIYTVMTTAEIQKDEQIFVNYGLNTIESYLQYYGMIPFQNYQKQNRFGSFSTYNASQIKQGGQIVDQNDRKSLIKLYNSLQNQVDTFRSALSIKNL